jgi:S1-C subfamily serine protease
MGFAIPINLARALADQMLEFGDIRRGALGFTYNNFMSGPPRDLKLSVPPPGAVVLQVDPQSAAERAGLTRSMAIASPGSRPCPCPKAVADQGAKRRSEDHMKTLVIVVTALAPPVTNRLRWPSFSSCRSVLLRSLFLWSSIS